MWDDYDREGVRPGSTRFARRHAVLVWFTHFHRFESLLPRFRECDHARQEQTLGTVGRRQQPTTITQERFSIKLFH